MGLTNILASIIAGYGAMLLFFVILTPIEILLPREKQSIAGRLKGLVFWTAWIPATVITYEIAALILGLLHITPLFSLPIIQAAAWTGPASIVIAPLIGAIATDFFFYWFHRAQHQWFWRFHAVHHSVRELNAVNSYHHFSEAAFRVLLFVIPTSFLVADQGPVLPVIATVIGLQPVFLHSPTRLHLGPLRVLLADNVFHRIHHSLEPGHFDKNFGACTTLWDRLFGTAYWPKQGEWPAVGLGNMPEPDGIREWLDLPLRFHNGPAPALVKTNPSLDEHR